MTSPLLLGIDFGTSTNFVTKYDFKKQSAVAVANMGGYAGSNIFDNCLYIESEHSLIIGENTIKRGISDPYNFFSDIKRHIINDDWVQIVPNLDNRKVSAQDLAQMIFQAIKEKVEKNESNDIDGAVITVPYAYGDKYKKRLKEAAENAGIKVLQMVEEPVAAAISFGVFGSEIPANKKEKIVVFDLGGGTFDITIFEFSKNDQQHAKIEVLNTDGVEKLGGKTIDELVADKFRQMLGVEYSEFSNKKAETKFRNDLLTASKKTKEELSYAFESEVYEPFNINSEPKELEIELERAEFEAWLKNNNILGQIDDALDRAIFDIGLEPEDIDRIILAGGTSSIPIIKAKVTEFFGKEPESRQNLGELVGHGAGVLAGLAYDNNLNFQVIRKTSKSIGIRTGANRFKSILHKNYKLGEKSSPHPLILTNADSEKRVVFYEGDSNRIEDCEQIGTATIDGTKFIDGKVLMALHRDLETGRLKFHFFDNNKQEVDCGFLENVE